MKSIFLGQRARFFKFICIFLSVAITLAPASHYYLAAQEGGKTVSDGKPEVKARGVEAVDIQQALMPFAFHYLPDLSDPTQKKLFMMYMRTTFQGTPANLDRIYDGNIYRLTQLQSDHPTLLKPIFANVKVSPVIKTAEWNGKTHGFVAEVRAQFGKLKAVFLRPLNNPGLWLGLENNLNEQHLGEIFSEQVVAVLNDKKLTVEKLLETYDAVFVKLAPLVGEEVLSQIKYAFASYVALMKPGLFEGLKSDNPVQAFASLEEYLERRKSFEVSLSIPDELTKGNPLKIFKSEIKSLDLLSKKSAEHQEGLTYTYEKSTENGFLVRQLSLFESPFRSCLAHDCATQTYFNRGYDPNYIYFTIFKNNKSKGHVTLVLGEAKDQATGKGVPVAFIDKVQKIPHDKLSIVLQAIQRTMKQSGYTLVIPEKLGTENGISNDLDTREFIRGLEEYSQSTQYFSKFKPHDHGLKFPNGFSRAENTLRAKALIEIEDEQLDFTLEDLNVDEGSSQNLLGIILGSIELKEGSVEDRIRYINSMQLLIEMGQPTDPDVFDVVWQWVVDKSTSKKLRMRALSFLMAYKTKFFVEAIQHQGTSEMVNFVQNIKQKETDYEVKRPFSQVAFWLSLPYHEWTPKLIYKMGMPYTYDDKAWKAISKQAKLLVESGNLENIKSKMKYAFDNGPAMLTSAIEFIVVMKAYGEAIAAKDNELIQEFENNIFESLFNFEKLQNYFEEKNWRELHKIVAAFQDLLPENAKIIFIKMMERNQKQLRKIVLKGRFKSISRAGQYLLSFGLMFMVSFHLLGDAFPDLPLSGSFGYGDPINGEYSDYRVFPILGSMIGIMGSIVGPFLSYFAEASKHKYYKQLLKKINAMKCEGMLSL